MEEARPLRLHPSGRHSPSAPSAANLPVSQRSEGRCQSLWAGREWWGWWGWPGWQDRAGPGVAKGLPRGWGWGQSPRGSWGGLPGEAQGEGAELWLESWAGLLGRPPVPTKTPPPPVEG